jgi:hypothetical protein
MLCLEEKLFPEINAAESIIKKRGRGSVKGQRRGNFTNPQPLP